ncbi:phthiocerol/phthiodiolone dimycocerosyl transferase family protein [Kitasatospora sp. LaBMicrA B282]|uniref:phthiocerol/phthiodiolone dimycocerosyl transferase family protein n=1 Tax=Kitasatospora sp. LaBMicrA B282 TaxID=3420949 RepID=UPI003D118667
METLYVGQRIRAVVASTVAGGVDPELLAAAFTDLTARHPPLRCRIAHASSGFVLQELEAPPHLIVREDSGDGYAEELNSPLPVGGPLVRATLLRGTGYDIVVLVVDHVISDGLSAATLHHALWERYGRLVADPMTTPERLGSEWPPPVTSLLPPCPVEEVERYLDQRLLQVRARPVELLSYNAPRSSPGGRIEATRLVLAPGPTQDLRQAAVAAGVSVHGVVAAALLIAARWRLSGEGPRTLGCLSPIDLRSRLTEPLPREVMVAAATSHTQTFDVTPEEDLLALAGAVTRGLRTALESGQALLEARIMPRAPEFPQLLAATVIATNVGNLAGPPLPAGLELLDMRGSPAREQYYPRAGRSPVMAAVSTFAGRLAIEFPYWTECFSGPFMADFRDEVQALLLDLAACGAGIPTS